MLVRRIGSSSPQLGQRVFVASNATLAGDVELGDDVNVWYGAVLRADLREIRIGARSNIQDGAVLHVDSPDCPTLVGQDVTIGHCAILHGCTVGHGALIGMHATVLNGAEVGEEAIVAAGALVPPGMKVPPRTMVAGVPAKVRRDLTDEDLAHVRRGVDIYLELKSRYLAGDGDEIVASAEEWENAR
ncbi:MAG: gamma carbonic anhydrase family protein [Acidobacteria bacterium]|nr:gamma carbonic anhydrase family protein [Acidobacteriota bacterium]